MIVEATVINSEPFDGTITCCSTQKFIDIYIEQVYDITPNAGFAMDVHRRVKPQPTEQRRQPL